MQGLDGLDEMHVGGLKGKVAVMHATHGPVAIVHVHNWEFR